jgi:hypothetical protein
MAKACLVAKSFTTTDWHTDDTACPAKAGGGTDKNGSFILLCWIKRIFHQELIFHFFEHPFSCQNQNQKELERQPTGQGHRFR